LVLETAIVIDAGESVGVGVTVGVSDGVGVGVEVGVSVGVGVAVGVGVSVGVGVAVAVGDVDDEADSDGAGGVLACLGFACFGFLGFAGGLGCGEGDGADEAPPVVSTPELAAGGPADGVGWW
jgi:hypothetical protein